MVGHSPSKSKVLGSVPNIGRIKRKREEEKEKEKKRGTENSHIHMSQSILPLTFVITNKPTLTHHY